MTREKEQLKITKHNFKRPKRSSRNEKYNKVSRTRQKINKKVDVLNNAINQLDLIVVCITFHPITAEYIFFSSAHGTFSRIDHILGHKSSLSKFKKIEIVPSIFSNKNTMRLEINYRETM